MNSPGNWDATLKDDEATLTSRSPTDERIATAVLVSQWR